MNLISFLLSLFVLPQFLTAQNDKSEIKLLNASDSLNYCIGVNIGNNLKSQGYTPLNIAVLSMGLEKSYNGDKTLISSEVANQFIQKHYQEIQQKKGESNKIEGEKFLAQNKTKKGVITTPSGLQYMIIKEGTG